MSKNWGKYERSHVFVLKSGFTVTFNYHPGLGGSKPHWETWYCWGDRNEDKYSPIAYGVHLREVVGRIRLLIAKEDPKFRSVHEKMTNVKERPEPTPPSSGGRRISK